MFVEIDRKRFLKVLDIARDRRPSGRASRVDETPYLRFAATSDGVLTLTGLSVEVSVPATVHRPGVVFLRASTFRQLIAALHQAPLLVMQMTREGLEFDGITVPFEGGDFEFHPDPSVAPVLHAADHGRAAKAREQAILDARRRVEEAKRTVLDSAQAMLIAERELAQLIGTKPDDRKTLADLFDKLP